MDATKFVYSLILIALLLSSSVMPHYSQVSDSTIIECDANLNGRDEEIGGLSSYITGPADSKAAVIMASDVYGYKVPHLRMIADKAGAFGFYTVVPDFFRGDPFINMSVQPIDQWKRNHTQDIGVEDANSIIEALKQKGIIKFGAVGFCWGGKVVVDLTKVPSVQVAVLLHPTEVTVPDIKGVKVPLSILGGEADEQTRPRTIKEFEAALKAKPEVDSFVKIYPNCSHGWSTRYDDSNEREVKIAEETRRDVLDWLTKHLTTLNPSSGSRVVREFGGLTFGGFFQLFFLFLLMMWVVV